MGARRFTSMVAVWLCMAAGCALLWGTPAQAKTVHVLAGSFGSEGTGPGQFKAPRGVAVNDTTHDVYVVDSQNNRVEQFNSTGLTLLGEFNGSAAPTGAFSEPTQIAIDNSGTPLDPSAGDVYVVDSGHGVIDKFSETGAYVGQLTGRCEAEKESPPCGKSKLIPFGSGIRGVAVDTTGMLWVAEFQGNVDNFSEALVNEYISTRETTSGLSALGVDSEDDLYLQTGGYKVTKYTSSGKELLNPFGFPEEYLTHGVAVDPTASEVYIDYNTKIEAFTLGGSQIESFGSGALAVDQYGQASQGVAVDASNGTVYATDFTANDVVVFDAVTLPSVALAALSEQRPRSVTLNGTVNPEGSPVTSCEFEYVAASEYEPGASNPYSKGAKVPCSPAGLGSGTSPVPVSAHITGLTPETRYHYRLVAENAAHLPSSTSDLEFTAGPVLGGEFVTNVASESATLNVQIDPNGDDTRYYFQFGPTTSYGFEAPLSSPGVDLGSIPRVQNISVHVQANLAPGTLYHYRVVILQNNEEFVEPDHTFATQGVTGGSTLPDGRAWELVSPANKKGALIEQFGNLSGVGDEIQAARDGSAIAYLTVGPAVGEDPQGKATEEQTMSVRAPGGWSSKDLTLPRRMPEPGSGEQATQYSGRPEYALFSSDLSVAAVEPSPEGTPPLSPEVSERTIYLRDSSSGIFRPLVTAANIAGPETHFGGENSSTRMWFVAATPDLSHVLLASPFALTEEAVFESSYPQKDQWNLYEWGAGRLQLVNILPEAEGGETTRGAGTDVRLAGGTDNEGSPSSVNPSAVSSDGRRIAWDLGVPGESSSGYEGFYVRDMVEERTVKVGGPSAVFQWMSSNGSEVFYLEGGDLYVFDFATDTRTDLTADHGAGESNGGVQQLVSDVSQDGSYVYFVAKSVLAGANGAVSGGDNLYLLHDGGGVWSTTYIATLSREDENDWFKAQEADLPDLSQVSSRVSPGGRYLAFMSNRSLTGYDNTDAVSGHPDEEVFLYDAQTGRLACASCDPTGARPVGVFDQVGKPLLADGHELWTRADPWLAGSIPGWDQSIVSGSRYQPRYLSDSGRLFFNSVDALVPRASNGLENVYEYEPAGIGGCNEGVSSGAVVYAVSTGGCVGLISSGISSGESAFFDASENGNDVFFITADKLVGVDYDNGYDVYDAHVCGSEGVACVVEPVSPPPCSSGDSCKAAPLPQPAIFGPTPSATFSGAGNVVEEAKPKAKGKAKKKARKRSKAAKRKAKGKQARGAARLRVGGASGRGGR
jgi:DNA-binding beta-propeller fold protein YncE